MAARGIRPIDLLKLYRPDDSGGQHLMDGYAVLI